MVETRALLPPEPIVPNDNDPATVPPATVGPPAYTPGDPHGLVIEEAGPPRSRRPPPRPMPWSGWPAEWNTPNWNGHVETLTDTAWGCLDLNSSLLGTMPPYLVGASDTLSADWLNNPDPTLYNSWCEFAKQLFWDYQMGEAFVLCTARYASGWPARFHVVPPWMVEPEIDKTGRRRYSIGQIDVTGDVLHVRYQSTTGDARGHGPLEVGHGRVVMAQMLIQYAAGLANGGGIPHSVLKHPDELTAEQSAELQAQWVNARLSSLGYPAVLSGGLDFDTIQLSPEDMALVGLAEFTEARICVLLGVPPFQMGLPSGGNSMTYSNVTSLFDYHWRASLRPKAATVMAAVSQWALPRGTNVELNRDAYVQPDPLVRAQTWEILIRTGVASADQVRAIERFNVAGFLPAGVM